MGQSPIKHEYLDGRVYAMAGGKNRHNDIAMNSAVSLGSQLRGNPRRPQISDTKVRVLLGGSVNFYDPDLSVSCDRNDDNESFQGQPVVIIEVLKTTPQPHPRPENAHSVLFSRSHPRPYGVQKSRRRRPQE